MAEAERFADWLAGRGRSANTVAAYRRDVASYLRWARDYPDSGLSDYVERLKATRKPSTAARAVVALRVFHRWRDGTTPDMDAPALAGLAVADGDDGPPPLSEGAVDALFAASEGRGVDRRREAAVLGLLYFAGLKATEAVALDVTDLTADGGVLTVARDGPRERVLSVVPALRQRLAAWLEPAGRPRLNPQDEALLVNRRGRRLTRQGLWLLTGAAARRADPPRAISPNDLRRACAEHLARTGLPSRAVSAYLGNSHHQPPGAGMLNSVGWGSCNLTV